MKKLLVYLVIVFTAVIAAGLFGMVHNQISYTVSPEYFTKFKFIQFGLENPALPERIRASEVGFFASWWMGVPLGMLVGLAGFIQRDAISMLRASLWSIAVLLGFTLLFGLGGLLYGWLQTKNINPADYGNWYVPDNLTELRRFLCAGYMHNSSYLGGTIGILPAWASQAVFRLRTAKSA